MKKMVFGICIFILFQMFSVMSISAQQQAGIPVLLYHNIADVFPENDLLLNISPARFEQHMDMLAKKGYHTIDFAQYQAWLEKKASLPENPIIITFDDGYLSNYTYAYPVIKKYGMKSTIFVITSRMGENGTTYPHFTWEQAKIMQESGIVDIQSHTHTHQLMNRIAISDAIFELRISKYLIEKNMGKSVDYFAFPYGLYSQEVLSAARSAGYRIISKVGDKGANHIEEGNQPVRRLTIGGNLSGDDLIDMIGNNLYD